MFKEFFIREIKMAFKQPMVYIFFSIFAIIICLLTVSDSVSVGGSIGVIHKNAPYIITALTASSTLFGLLIATAFFNNAALRDYNYQFNEILFSSPLSKPGYFFGRFTGALVLATLPLTGIFVGFVLGSIIGPLGGWSEADRYGPNNLLYYLNTYLLFVVPNMLFAGSIIFAMANKWKSTIISFVGTLVIIIGYAMSQTLMSDIENQTIAAMLDPFGLNAFEVYSKYYTPIEKNTIAPSFSGILLANRVLWFGLGLLTLTLAYFSFSFKEKNKSVKKAKEKKQEIIPLFEKPQVTIGNYSSGLSAFVSFFKLNFLSITKSVTFKILFLFSALILIVRLFEGFEAFGLQSYPVTYKMIDSISTSTSLFIMIILVFFSGELIWRDRDNHLNEVIDATPHLSFSSLIAKTLSLFSVTLVFHFFFTIIGVIYQIINGYFRLEIDLYFYSFLLSKFPQYLLWSSILIFIQVVVNQKYIAYFISILFLFISDIILNIIDVQTNMLDIGGGPSTMYSEMNGFGPGLVGALWFKTYWLLFGAILILEAGLLWNRGVRLGFKSRINQFRTGFTGKYAVIMSSTVVLWVLVSSFIFYNTQILNEYDSRDEREQQSIDYENKYSKYKNVVRPKICAVEYRIDIFPENNAADINAILSLTNTSSSPIDSIHFTLNESWNHKVSIPNSELVFHDSTLDYQIFKLNNKLKFGDTISIEISAKYAPKGFKNSMGNTSVVKNGTFFNNMSILPSFGYNEGYEIGSKNKRKKFGLKPKDRMPKLTENCDKECNINYLTDGLSDWVKVETYISTSENQVAIAPGSKISEEVKDGRRYYHYKVDHASQNFYSFMSARYEIATRIWQGINLEVYYDKNHAYNIEMMLDAIQSSLEYYTENFGPYYHKQARIIEFPRYSSFAQAFPGTMPYSEGIGFISDLENEDNNIINAVIAHEMAHQWWAHQEVSANVQGATMLTESFAEYSSLMVMKQTSDPMKMTKFLKYNFDRYLGGRSFERRGENPLYKVENQSYLHYGKGSIIMYALQEYIGEDKVNNALRAFLDSTKYKAPPYPTTYDFLACLEAQIPDSMKYLIKDWFKEITLYDFRLKKANYEKLSDGKYKIDIEFEAIKTYSDSIGNTTEQALNEWVDIGAMTDSNDQKLLVVNRINVNKKEMTYSFITNKKPGKIVIDPKRLLIEKVIKDNSKTAAEK